MSKIMMLEMTNFVGSFIKKRFGYGKIGKATMSRTDYRGDLECAYLGGLLLACEEIFKLNKNGKFQSKDDVIAELHLVYLDHFNYFQTNYGYKVADKADLSRPINLSENGYGETMYI